MNIRNSDVGRLAAFGNQLVEIHLWLREELARLRSGNASQRRDLRAQCLAFCSALSRHHTGEDRGAFPALAARFPELRPVLEELERDHHQVAEILQRITELADSGKPIPQTEFDSLAALLESHFVYEEKKLLAALNSLDTKAFSTEALLGVQRSTATQIP